MGTAVPKERRTKAGRAEMGTSFINDPEHWRNRAAEARTLADQMNDEPSK